MTSVAELFRNGNDRVGESTPAQHRKRYQREQLWRDMRTKLERVFRVALFYDLVGHEKMAKPVRDRAEQMYQICNGAARRDGETEDLYIRRWEPNDTDRSENRLIGLPCQSFKASVGFLRKGTPGLGDQLEHDYEVLRRVAKPDPRATKTQYAVHRHVAQSVLSGRGPNAMCPTCGRKY